MPDEAQYWTWSQFLDVGYYSKPPGIAWQIACGTTLLGQAELGVRCISLLLPLISALVIRRIVLHVTGEQRPSWLAATAYILSPLGMTASFLATTDSGMVLFWLLATYFYLSMESRPRRFLVVGSLIAVGALWKWMIYSFWFVAFADLVLQKRKDGVAPFMGGVLISLLGLLPALYWNWFHDFVTFQHVGATVFARHSTPSSGNPLAFFFAGVALLSPGFFFLSLPGLWGSDKKTRFMRLAIILIWGGLFLLSCSRKMQGNWAVLAQAMCFPLLGVVLAKKPLWQKWPFRSAVAISIILQALVLISPYLAGVPLKLCPFTQGMGCSYAHILKKSGYREGRDFVFSDRYQTTGQLWFHGIRQEKVYFLNIHGVRQNQYSYWPGMREECIGKTGFFVASFPIGEKSDAQQRMKRLKNILKEYFDKVGRPSLHQLCSRPGTPIHCMVVIRCERFNGHLPEISPRF